ncbi:MAG: hypothetical protein HRU76_06000 [Phycisphaeraceae bacterium]|nr:MAG: hypothetical protein HRU76_06000 [Phycisphaeraceae bacterium]
MERKDRTMCIGKTLFRTALIGGLAVGGLVILAPDHMKAGFHQVKTKVQATMDTMIDDPVAIRRQLQSLAESLPKKIGELQAEIAEVDAQIAQMSRDTDVARRVVANTAGDLNNLTQLIARATDAQRDGGGIVQVRYEGQRLDLNQAKAEFVRISKLREQYADRIALNERDMGYLTQQRDRLAALLENLQGEYAAIEAQMWAIDRKIDAIARSERLADTLEERHNAIARFGKFDSKSLEEIQGKIRKWEIETTARLQALEQRFAGKDYEREAQRQLDFEKSQGATIELPEGGEEKPAVERTGNSFAFLPRVIE